jgi:hypothetical protein
MARVPETLNVKAMGLDNYIKQQSSATNRRQRG